MADTDLNLLKAQLKHLAASGSGLFNDFKQKRDERDDMIRRRAPPQIEESLQKWADGIDIQSPDLLYFLQQWVDGLTISPPKVFVTSKDASKTGRDDNEDNRLWFSTQLKKHDRGDRISRARAHAIARYGVAVERLLWHMPEEPDEGTERESYFEDYSEEVFRIEPVNPLECAWFPLDPLKVELFIQEAEVPFIEAVNLQDSKGDYLNMDRAGKVSFMGAPMPVNASTSEWMGKKVRVVTRAMLNKETGNWQLDEFAYCAGTSVSDTGTLMNSCDVPFPRCPFFVIPSTMEQPLETDPHLRFPPLMEPLYVDIQENNYIRTKTVALAIKLSDPMNKYIDITSLRPEHASFLEEVFPVEGAGAQRRLVFRMPEPGSGEIAALPRVAKFEDDIAEVLRDEIRDNKEAIASHAPSRFVTGNVEPGEVSEGKATTFVNMQQAASIPFVKNNRLMDHYGWVQELEAEACAIRYWDEGTKEAGGSLKRYYAVMTGENEDTTEGQVIFTDARKLSRKYELEVWTHNQTQAEEMQEALMAFQDRSQGIITDEQTVARRNFEDPRRQMRELEKEKFRKASEQQTMQLTLQMIAILTAAETQANIPAIMGLTAPTAPTPPGMPGSPPAPENAVPNMRPGHPPVWLPSNNNPPPPPPPAFQTGMTPSPINVQSQGSQGARQ